jgi:hypothetical protein
MEKHEEGRRIATTINSGSRVFEEEVAVTKVVAVKKPHQY